MLDGSLIGLPYPLEVVGGHFEVDEVEPGVVVVGVLGDEFLIVDASLVEDDVVNFLLRSILLLKCKVLLVELKCSL